MIDTGSMRNTNGYKEIHIRLLKVKYEKKVERWQKPYICDDRTFFCSLYYKLLHVFETLPDELDNYVLVALNKQFRKDEETLDQIAKVFEGR